MAHERSEKVRKAREMARQALGRTEAEMDDYHGLPPRRTPLPRPPTIRLEPIGEKGEPCLGIGEAARALGVSLAKAEAMIAAGELVTVPVGDWGGRLVPRAEVDRIKALRDGP